MTSILVSSWGISAQLIIEEAEKQGLQYKIVSKQDNLFYIQTTSGNKIFFKSVDFGQNSSFGLKAANNKEINYILAEEHNIRIPQSNYIDRKDFEANKINTLTVNFPVISKPIDGGHGDGVSLNIKNHEELKKGLKFSFSDPETTRVVIQEQISGDDHRILVVDGKVAAASKRIPPYIIGTGDKTIEELITIENSNPLRGKGGDHDAPMSKIKIDDELIQTIQASGYKLSSILEKEKQLFVRNNANLSSGGLAIDVTDIMHPEVKKEAEKMAKVLQLGLCGIDFMCEDISKDLQEGKGAIIESGATPGIRMHHFPSQGISRNVAKLILQSALKSKQQGKK